AETWADRIGATTGDHVAGAGELLRGIPDSLMLNAHQPEGAGAMMAALLLQVADPEILNRQRPALTLAGTPFADQTPAIAAQMADLVPAARLALLDLALATLRSRPLSELERLKNLCAKLIEADGRVSLFELAVQRMLQRAVDQIRHPGAPVRNGSLSAESVREEASILLAGLARQSRQPESAYEAALRILFPNSSPVAPPKVQEVGMDRVVRALERLEGAAPAVKRLLMTACAESVSADGEISAGEGELLRAVAAALNCPIPLLLTAG
ncbi:MAG: hypothetical protein U1E27_08670, partial [Kiritimatiellia bacterium]|nr:hypothetical protein [Kiritimatiellia bacterium]